MNGSIASGAGIFIKVNVGRYYQSLPVFSVLEKVRLFMLITWFCCAFFETVGVSRNGKIISRYSVLTVHFYQFGSCSYSH